MEYNKDTLCLFPFSQVYLSATKNGLPVRPCCHTRSHIRNHSTLGAFRGNHMSRIRSDLLNGIKTAHCQKCWDIEKIGGESYRKKELFYAEKENRDINDIIQRPKILNIEVNLSNKCNLKCLMCHSGASNQIGIEEGLKNSLTDQLELYNDLPGIAQDIKMIRFAGGEPFLHDQMYKILDYLIENNMSKNIELVFNTNGTVARNSFLNKQNFSKRSNFP